VLVGTGDLLSLVRRRTGAAAVIDQRPAQIGGQLARPFLDVDEQRIRWIQRWHRGARRENPDRTCRATGGKLLAPDTRALPQIMSRHVEYQEMVSPLLELLLLLFLADVTVRR